MLEHWHIILIVIGGVAVIVLGCACILCSYRLILSKHSRISAERKMLFERADKLEREAIQLANELPQDPDERNVKEDLISHKTQEASKLRDQAARLPQERYNDLLEKADQKQREEDEMIKNLSSDSQIAKLQKRTIEDIRGEKNVLRKEAHRRMAISAEQKLLYERADKLEREVMELANELPQDPDKRKVKESVISHKQQEAFKLRDQAARLPRERYNDLLEKADQKQREEDEKIRNLSSDPQIAKLQL